MFLASLSWSESVRLKVVFILRPLLSVVIPVRLPLSLVETEVIVAAVVVEETLKVVMVLVLEDTVVDVSPTSGSVVNLQGSVAFKRRISLCVKIQIRKTVLNYALVHVTQAQRYKFLNKYYPIVKNVTYETEIKEKKAYTILSKVTFSIT